MSLTDESNWMVWFSPQNCKSSIMLKKSMNYPLRKSINLNLLGSNLINSLWKREKFNFDCMKKWEVNNKTMSVCKNTGFTFKSSGVIRRPAWLHREKSLFSSSEKYTPESFCDEIRTSCGSRFGRPLKLRDPLRSSLFEFQVNSKVPLQT